MVFKSWVLEVALSDNIVVKNSELFSLFTGLILNLKNCLVLLLGRLADSSSIKRHFLKMRISPVNKKNNLLYFTAMRLIMD